MTFQISRNLNSFGAACRPISRIEDVIRTAENAQAAWDQDESYFMAKSPLSSRFRPGTNSVHLVMPWLGMLLAQPPSFPEPSPSYDRWAGLQEPISMSTDEIMAGKVHVHLRDTSPAWQCATFFKGRNHRISTRRRGWIRPIGWPRVYRAARQG
jgi:hypothetical protein